MNCFDSVNELAYRSQFVALFRSYIFGFIGFEAVSFLLEQNRKYKIVHILSYLTRFSIISFFKIA
jgi:hypothetical protein